MATLNIHPLPPRVLPSTSTHKDQTYRPANCYRLLCFCVFLLDGQADRHIDSAGQKRGLTVQNCACQKASHSSGNVEMVKEIGMRVGGPSVSQMRGMRSEGEMGERVREERAHTFSREKRKKRRERLNKEKENKRAQTSWDMKAVRETSSYSKQRQNGAWNVSKHLSCSYPKFHRSQS